MEKLTHLLAAATGEELTNVLLHAAATFRAIPTTKEEAVAKRVFLAALAEAIVRERMAN